MLVVVERVALVDLEGQFPSNKGSCKRAKYRAVRRVDEDPKKVVRENKYRAGELVEKIPKGIVKDTNTERQSSSRRFQKEL